MGWGDFWDDVWNFVEDTVDYLDHIRIEVNTNGDIFFTAGEDDYLRFKAYSFTDTNDRSDWRTMTNYYDGTGNLVYRQQTMDNGNIVRNWYEDGDLAVRKLIDRGAEDDWQTQTIVYDDFGNVNFRNANYDDGTSRFLDNDARDSWNWETRATWFDRGDFEDIRITNFDDGRTSYTDFDQRDRNEWERTTTVIDPSGRPDYVSVLYDDQSRTITDHDQAGAGEWLTAVTSYDRNAAVDRVAVYYDAGGSRSIDYDQGDAHDWSHVATDLDALGHTVFEEVLGDDNSRHETTFDVARALAGQGLGFALPSRRSHSPRRLEVRSHLPPLTASPVRPSSALAMVANTSSLPAMP
jgi:hypothetical protein